MEAVHAAIVLLSRRETVSEREKRLEVGVTEKRRAVLNENGLFSFAISFHSDMGQCQCVGVE